MTAQRSSSDKPCKEIVNRKLFKNELCRNWPQLVLFLAIFTIFFVIPISFIMNSAPVITNPDSDKATALIANLNVFMQVITVVSAMLGVFSGLMTVTHINSKVAVGFWHSLPTSREGLLITGISVRSIYYLVSMAASVIAAMLMIAPSHCLARLMPTLMLAISYAIAYFAMYYGITLFAGMITGTAVTRFLMTGFIVFAPVAASALLLWIFGYSTNFTDTTYYYNTVIARLIPSLFADDGILKCIIFVVTAAVFFTLAFILYRKRKSESAGTPVTYRVAEEIVRYTCMFCATAVVGLVFDAIFDGIGIIVGFAIGALFSFAAINAVFRKSAHAMFSNIKSLAIFALVFALVFVFFGLDIANLDEAIPPVAITKRIELSDNGLSYDFSSKDDIEFVANSLKALIEHTKQPSENEILVDKETVTYFDSFGYYSTGTISVKIYPYIGLPIVKEIRCDEAYLIEFFESINQRVSSEKSIKNTLKKCEDFTAVFLSGYDYYSSIRTTESNGTRELYSYLASHADYYTEDNTDDVIIGMLRFRTTLSGDTVSQGIPIYSRDSELIAKVKKVFPDYCEPSITTERFVSELEKLVVYDTVTKDTYEFTESSSELALIADALSSWYFDMNTSNYLSFFTLSGIDERYFVRMTTVNGDEYETYFREDRVPSAVTDPQK